MGIKTIAELDIGGRRLFVRVDFNVPLTPEGKVSRRHPHPGKPADHQAGDRARGAGRARLPPRPPQGQARQSIRQEVHAGAGRGPAGGAARRRRGADRRAGGRRRPQGGERFQGRRGRAAREPPLLARRGGQRRGVLRALWPATPTSTSTMPSAPRTVPTPRRSASPSSSPPRGWGLLMEREVKFLGKLLRRRGEAASWRSSAARRSPTRSACSTIRSRASTRS